MTTALRKTLALLVAMMMIFAISLVAMPAVLAEGTDENEVTEDDVIDEEGDDTEVEEDLEDEDLADEDLTDEEDAPQTGDFAGNAAVLAAAAAIVAAGALSFVMKKARD